MVLREVKKTYLNNFKASLRLLFAPQYILKSFELTTFNKVFQDFNFNINCILYSELKEDTPRDKLIKYRLMNGLTQRGMTKLLGIGFITLCRYEKEKDLELRLNL